MLNYNWRKNIITFTSGWIIALVLWSIIREVGIKTYLETLSIKYSILNSIIFVFIFSSISGAVFGSVQYYHEQRTTQKISFKSILFSALIIHVVIMIFLYFLVYATISYFNGSIDILFRDFLRKPIIIINLFYSLLTNSLIVFFIHINKLLGKGNLAKFITGKFYSPSEEYRSFMFLDLKSSTTIAERLGHLKYSKLIQDCFYDLSVIEKTNVAIYQYVGDEVVLTYKLSPSDSIDNCLHAFFLFTDKLNSRNAYYQTTYGITPVFKAGMHLGNVTTTEVGSLKREIAYHGDAINIASRIQDQCNTYDKSFLVSDAVFNCIEHKKSFHVKPLAEIVLKGKTKATALFSIEKVK